MVKSQIPAESAPTFLLASRERGQGERFPFRQNRQLTQPRIVISGKNGNRFTMCGNLGNRLDGMSEFVGAHRVRPRPRISPTDPVAIVASPCRMTPLSHGERSRG